MSEKHKCEAEVPHGSGWRRYYTACGATASVYRDGKWYCLLHDTVAKAAKAAARRKEWEASHAREARRDLCEKACANLTDEQLKAMIEKGAAL